MAKKKNKHMTHSNYVERISMIIILLVLSLIPLLVRVYQITYPNQTFSWYLGDSTFFDIYGVVKSRAIMILGFASAVILGIRLKERTFKDSKLTSPFNILSLLLGLLFILSTLFSINIDVSLLGFIERYESVWVWLSYLTIAQLAYQKKWQIHELKTIFNGFWISTLIMSVIGLLQYFGFDIIRSSALKPFITSFGLLASKTQFELSNSLNYKAIIQTLYHYNYVGFLSSMSLVIFLSMFLYASQLKYRLLYMLTSLLILFNLIGSIARGGLVGFIVAFICFLIINRSLIFRNLKVVMILFVCLLITGVGFEVATDGFLTSRFKSIFDSNVSERVIEQVYTEDNAIIVDFSTHTFEVTDLSKKDNDWTFNFILDDQPIKHSSRTDDGKLVFQIEDKNILFYYANYNGDYHLALEVDGLPYVFNFIDNQLMLRNVYGNYVVLPPTERFGFEGRENLGSARGYIWSRTIPLIMDRPILGYGIDTFPLAFPQEDYIGKRYAYNETNMIVDKAHNIYLQMAVNSGLIAVIAYIAILLLPFVIFVRYRRSYRNSPYMVYYSIGLCATVAYIISGLFSDSSVNVSPVLWGLIGLTLSLLNDGKNDNIDTL